MTEPATFTTYEALIAAMRQRRIALGLSQLAVDELAGLPSGYVGKVEATLTNPSAKNARGIGRESLPLMLGALGIKIAIYAEDRSPATTVENSNSIKGKRRPPIKNLAERGQKGGRIRWARMTDKQRAAMIRKMNRARAAKRSAKSGKPAR